MKDVQAAGEAASPQKRTFSTSKQYISSLFSFVDHFGHLDIILHSQCGFGFSQPKSLWTRIHSSV
jgi:hypothetical protein